MAWATFWAIFSQTDLVTLVSALTEAARAKMQMQANAPFRIGTKEYLCNK
jgi:hypothetical protein